MNLLRLLALAVPLLLSASSGPQADSPDPNEHEAVQAYRAGDVDTAASIWREELQSAKSPRERARLAYDLGNCAYRADDWTRSIAWYTASLRLAPRQADAWYNLELARGEAGLEPADRGDLNATLARLLSSLTLAESEWLVLASLVLFLLVLLGEAWRGRVFRPWIGIALVMVLAALAPWLWNLARAGGRPMMVLAEGGAAARSEPSRTGKILGELEAGEQFEAVDSLPDWGKVRDPDLGEVWVRAEDLFDLSL